MVSISQIQASQAANYAFSKNNTKPINTQYHPQNELISFEGAQALKSLNLANLSFTGVGNCGDYLAQEITKNVLDVDKAKFDFRSDEDPVVGRIVIENANWSGKPEHAKQLLTKVCDNWPQGEKVKFLQTCGGFAKFDWPENLSEDKPMEQLTAEAEKVARKIFDKSLTKKLAKVTNYVTFGIDSSSTPEGKFSKPHTELVGIYDIKKDEFHWTGKSYPFGAQENGLVKVDDLESHFLNLDGNKVMVLGCHDLSVFGPRTQKVASTQMRKDIISGIVGRAQEFKPTIALQHPHTTDTFNTWYLPWVSMDKQVPSVEVRASSGKHYNAEGKPRKSLDDCLERTKKGSTMDIVVSN